MTTLHELTNPTSKHILPCGAEIVTHKLLTKDYQACLQQYGYFIEALAIATETPEPTMDDIRKFLPSVMMEVYTTYSGVGQIAIESFLNIFTESLTPEMIALFDLSDFEAVWQIIYEGNKIPFEMRLRLLLNGGALTDAIAKYKLGLEGMRKKETETQNSSTSSLEQDSIPETEVLPLTTSSQLPKSKSSTKQK